MVKAVFAVVANLRFWSPRAERRSEWYELERVAAHLREIERHPESVTGGRSEWELKH